MKTTEDEIKLLKQAHSRLNEDYKSLYKKYTELDKCIIAMNSYIQSQVLNISTEIDNIKSTQPVKLKPAMTIGNNYMEKISEIISCEKKNWNNSDFSNYILKLEQREELYTAFVSIKNELKAGIKIRFNYDGDGKLKQIKII